MERSGIFSIDSPLWKYLGRIFDAFWLTILWAVFSLPIVTVGASTVALYTVTLRIMRNEEGAGLTKQFAVAFKENLKQGTAASIIAGFAGLAVWVSFKNIKEMDQGEPQAWVVAVIILLAVALMIVKYLFPVIARFSNSLGNLLVISILIALKNLGWSILMLTITACYMAVAVFLFWPLLLFSAGAMALFDSWILHQLFFEYIEKNKIGQQD